MKILCKLWVTIWICLQHIMSWTYDSTEEVSWDNIHNYCALTYTRWNIATIIVLYWMLAHI